MIAGALQRLGERVDRAQKAIQEIYTARTKTLGGAYQASVERRDSNVRRDSASPCPCPCGRNENDGKLATVMRFARPFVSNLRLVGIRRLLTHGLLVVGCSPSPQDVVDDAGRSTTNDADESASEVGTANHEGSGSAADDAGTSASGSISVSDGTATIGDRETEGEASTGDNQAVVDYATLREAAAAAGKRIGVAVRPDLLAVDAEYAAILVREFGDVTPEDSGKWGVLAPTPNTYDWDDMDALVDFAGTVEQAVKGHTFVWHLQTPSWVSESMTADQLNTALRQHIETTLDRYRGRIRAWDVVNEAVNIDTESGYTESVFFNVLGPEYIENAFFWARAADPEIMLIYNEVGIERMGPKSDFTYDMIEDLLARGVPIDGIGFQSHVSTHRYPSETDLRANIRRFADLGLVVNISEVDARTRAVPGNEASRWQAERVAFQQIVGACAVEPGCEAITFWGVTDQYSWLNDDGPEDGLIYDRSYLEKPAYRGVMDGLAGFLPTRGANRLTNADFAAGSEAWSAVGGQLAVGPAQGRVGNAGCVRGRSGATDGIVQDDLLDDLAVGGPLTFSTWVRASASSTVDASLLITETGAEPYEFNVATIVVPSGAWIELNGNLTLGFEVAPTAIGLKVHGPGAGVELCVADVRLQPLSVDTGPR